jgi:hypothetical protein
VLALIALGAVFALPAFAAAQDVADGLFDETEPQTVIDHVKVSSKKGLAKVYFSATDPVNAVEGYDCFLDGGKGESDDADDESDDWEDDDGDQLAAARKGDVKWDCASPWVVSGLDPGKHVVEVSAYDEEWNEDSTPAKAQFKVKKPK